MLRPFSWTVVFVLFSSTSRFICFLITAICTSKALMALGECWDEMLWVIIPFWKALWTLCNPGKEEKFYYSLYCRGEKSYARINLTEPMFHLEAWNDSPKTIPKVRGVQIFFVPLSTCLLFWSHGLPVTISVNGIFPLDSSVERLLNIQ